QLIKIPVYLIKKRTLLGISGTGIGLFALSLYWFYAFSYNTLIGDDLVALVLAKHGVYVSSFIQGLTTVLAGTKFRPVFTSLFSLLIQAFGTNFQAYVVFNILVELLNVGLLGLISYKFARRRRLIALSASLL